MKNHCLLTMIAAALLLVGCGKGDGSDTDVGRPVPGAPAPTTPPAPGGHAHNEVPIGTVTIAGTAVSGAQDHGLVEAGKNMHLVVKLDYNDGGETIVRAWIGNEDRTRSRVGKGEYAASHDDYDIHVDAPDPRPENAAWWMELEKPDGTTAAGSLPILVE